MNESKIYYIPENFISESRILQGKIRLRYLVDGIGLGLVQGFTALTIAAAFFPEASTDTVIAAVILSAAPGLVFGLAGYNGDPLSSALRSMLQWRRRREVLLYDPNPCPMAHTPIELQEEENSSRDRILELMETVREKKRDRRRREVYVEGETFRFAADPYREGMRDERLKRADRNAEPMQMPRIELREEEPHAKTS